MSRSEWECQARSQDALPCARYNLLPIGVRQTHFLPEKFAMTSRVLSTIVLFGLVWAAPLCAADELLKRVPGGANAMMVIDVAALQSTPMAQAPGWAKKHEAAFVERPMMLPPEASRIVLASQLNFAGELNVDWEVAVMSLLEPLSMRSIARSEGGYLDKIGEIEDATASIRKEMTKRYQTEF